MQELMAQQNEILR
jgi:hypothetical protein